MEIEQKHDINMISNRTYHYRLLLFIRNYIFYSGFLLLQNSDKRKEPSHASKKRSCSQY